MREDRKEILLAAAIYLQKFVTAAADVLWLILLAELIGEAIPEKGGPGTQYCGDTGKMAQYVLGLILVSAWKRMGYSLGRSLTLKLQSRVRFRLNCRMVEKISRIPYRLLEDYGFCELEQALRENIDGNYRESFVWFTVQKSGNFMMYCIRTLGLCLLLGWASAPLGILFFLLEICHCLMTVLEVRQDAALEATGQSSPEKQYMKELALGQKGAGERSLFAYAGYIGEKCHRRAGKDRRERFIDSLECAKGGLANRILVTITYVLTESALCALMIGGRISRGYFIALSIGACNLTQKNEEGDALWHLQRERAFLKKWKRFLNLPETEDDGEGDGKDAELSGGKHAGEKNERGDGGQREGDGEEWKTTGRGRRERQGREKNNAGKGTERKWGKTEKEDSSRAGHRAEDKAEAADKEGKRNEWKRNEWNRNEWNRDNDCGAQEKFETLEFKEVSFRYPRTGRYVLHDLNFKVTGGGYYAFVGANGSGKTTIVKLLSGLYDNYEGEIRLNGIELREIPFCERRRIFAVLFQDAARYEDTIVQNIFPQEKQEAFAERPYSGKQTERSAGRNRGRGSDKGAPGERYGRKSCFDKGNPKEDLDRKIRSGGISDEDPHEKILKSLPHRGGQEGVKKENSSARQLAEELVREWEIDGSGRFPQGADTFLGNMEEKGVILSKGEWQQLLIARELAQPAQIRVLDEPMASLDIFRQGKVCERFTQEAGSHTTLLFSHHMAAVRKAKRIFVLREGTVVEEGSHRQLMEESGLYARMYEIQCLEKKPEDP